MVDALMSRDSDSQIVPREEDAVHEWLKSDKIFHVMRDHPAHCLFGFILGGMYVVFTVKKYTHTKLHFQVWKWNSTLKSVGTLLKNS
jgi:hypothetical protein